MRVLMQRWELLTLPEKVTVTLASACVLTFSSGGIAHAASTTAASNGLHLAGLVLLAAALLSFLTFGFRGRNAPHWTRRLAVAGTLTLIVFLALYPIPVAASFAWIAFKMTQLLWSLVFLSYCQTISVRAIRWLTGARMMAANVIIIMIVVLLFVAPPFIVLLASNGSAADFALLEPINWSHWTWAGFLESITIDAVFVFLILLPELAHRALPWNVTSELTKGRVTRWLATGAALLTGLLVFMFHFLGQPLAHGGLLAQGGLLAHIGLGPLVIGTLFAVALLLPIYRAVIRAFWEQGVLHLIDLGRWRTDWKKVLKEVRAGRDRLATDLEASLGSKQVQPRNSQPEEKAPAS